MERIASVGWPDRAIGELAARQHSIVARWQLLELGVSRSAIRRAVRRGRVHVVHRGVYSLLAPRARPRFAAEQAALLACGPSAILSHQSAAGLHGLRLPARKPEVIHVTTSGDFAHRHAGVVAHRTATLLPGESHRVRGLPVTSVARTLLDVAPHYRDRQLAPLIDQALRMTSRAKLATATANHPRRAGAQRLHRLLDPARPSEDTWSRAEARLLEAIRRAGLPAPEANMALGGYVADLLWREQRVIVEYDSDAYHGGPAAFDHDRTRHNDLAAHGDHQILHVTERHLTRERERVLVWIAVALSRPGRRPPADAPRPRTPIER